MYFGPLLVIVQESVFLPVSSIGVGLKLIPYPAIMAHIFYAIQSLVYYSNIYHLLP